MQALGGYSEIQRAPQRYRIVDRAALAEALDIELRDLADIHREWVESAVRAGRAEREARWTECVAVGSRIYVERFRQGLGGRGRFRLIEEEDGTHVLREAPEEAYAPSFAGERAALS